MVVRCDPERGMLMERSDEGDYCLYADYEQLEKERDVWKWAAHKMASIVKAREGNGTDDSFTAQEAQAIIDKAERSHP